MLERQQTAFVAGEYVSYSIRRSRRAKHILLQVDIENQVEVVIPWEAKWQDGEKIVCDKHDWLRRQRQLNRRKQHPLSFTQGSRFPFLGDYFVLFLNRNRQLKRPLAVRQHGELILSLPNKASARQALANWYCRQARIFFTHSANDFAGRLGIKLRRVTVGNHKSQWGSCSQKGRLSFNWRLLLGPRWVAEYVVAHEVAHLIHRNHSTSFWTVVAELYPEHKKARSWLRHRQICLVW